MVCDCISRKLVLKKDPLKRNRYRDSKSDKSGVTKV